MAVSKRTTNREAIEKDIGARSFHGKTREIMTQHNFRMRESDYRALEEHFRSLDLSIGAGLRMVLRRYMNENGVR